MCSEKPENMQAKTIRKKKVRIQKLKYWSLKRGQVRIRKLDGSGPKNVRLWATITLLIILILVRVVAYLITCIWPRQLGKVDNKRRKISSFGTTQSYQLKGISGLNLADDLRVKYWSCGEFAGCTTVMRTLHMWVKDTSNNDAVFVCGDRWYKKRWPTIVYI